jgi:hypothetical protein
LAAAGKTRNLRTSRLSSAKETVKSAYSTPWLLLRELAIAIMLATLATLQTC